MKLPHRRNFLHLAAGAAALPSVSRIASGASLSVAAGAHPRRLCGRRLIRHPRAPARTVAVRATARLVPILSPHHSQILLIPFDQQESVFATPVEPFFDNIDPSEAASDFCIANRPSSQGHKILCCGPS